MTFRLLFAIIQDKGTGDVRVLKLLLALKKKHPERVHFIIGSRDGCKLRFASELSDDALKDDALLSDVTFPYWLPEDQRITPEAYLAREGLEDCQASRIR